MLFLIELDTRTPKMVDNVAMCPRWLFVVLTVVVGSAVAGCRSEADRLRDEFKARLKTAAPLTPGEMTRLMDETNRAMEGKRMRFANNGVSHEPNEQERAAVVTLIHGQLSVEDGGVRDGNGVTMRGIAGPATPVNSELEAIGSVWIDVETFLPRRYEFTYGQGGSGDYAFDISW